MIIRTKYSLYSCTICVSAIIIHYFSVQFLFSEIYAACFKGKKNPVCLKTSTLSLLYVFVCLIILGLSPDINTATSNI